MTISSDSCLFLFCGALTATGKVICATLSHNKVLESGIQHERFAQIYSTFPPRQIHLLQQIHWTDFHTTFYHFKCWWFSQFKKKEFIIHNICILSVLLVMICYNWNNLYCQDYIVSQADRHTHTQALPLGCPLFYYAGTVDNINPPYR